MNHSEVDPSYNAQANSQILSSGLWVVATPIGNLGDLTPRAKLALQNADIILCEDTRRTAILMSALGMSYFRKKLLRMDAYTPVQRLKGWIEELQKGRNFALVTDAGTPGISDPGSLLVAQAREAGVRVTPFPGVSAVLTLLSVAGFQETEFIFCGFFPRKEKDQQKQIRRFLSRTMPSVVVWFESPNRILNSIRIIQKIVPQAQIVVGKELTKIHENFFSGFADQVLVQVEQVILSKGAIGEWCFVVNFPRLQESESDLLLQKSEVDSWVFVLECLLDGGVSLPVAVKQVSQKFVVSKNSVYREALAISAKKNKEGG